MIIWISTLVSPPMAPPQIIALLGSPPRPKGNTAKLMNEAVRGNP
ncbi:hypothetical protein [Methanogenium cariaci]|nr:hypothetical protein [Methanogenium cariaci]